MASSCFEKLKSTDYPTFTDLYNLIVEKLEKETIATNILKLDNLKSKLTSLTQGTYAKYWNGHTKFQWKQTNVWMGYENYLKITIKKLLIYKWCWFYEC